MLEKQSGPPANILVVDDTHTSLRLLVEILTEQGYTVRPATSGLVALTAIQQELPDLILLDIMLPDLDGFAVCRAIKANERSRHIPVIFITALDVLNHKVQAFAEGGVDYVTKPFQAEEIVARVATHLALRQMQKQLHEQVAELDTFAQTVAHDIKGPLGLIAGYTDILVEAFETLDINQLRQSLENIHRASHRAVKIVDSLLLLSSVRKMKVAVEPLDMAAILAEVQQQLAAMMLEYQGQIIMPADWPVALGYPPWIETVWTNYLSNGLKYGGRRPLLELGAAPQADGMIRFWIRDNGPGLHPEEQTRLFNEFIRLDQTPGKGYGLGLSIVKRIINKLGGHTGVESAPGQGSTFYFTLPADAR
jgi:signal transduction histidine kinase